jgi:hypothetical protein
MSHISPEEWALYEDTINDFHDDAFQQPITLSLCIRQAGQFSADSTALYEDKEIKGLILYNHFRSWPINTQTITGEIDKESVLLFLNTEYLRSLDLVNDNGLLKFKPANDYFTIDGLRYKPSGDSKTAQTNDKTLLNFVVLRRDIINTGQSKY